MTIQYVALFYVDKVGPAMEQCLTILLKCYVMPLCQRWPTACVVNCVFHFAMQKRCKFCPVLSVSLLSVC